MLTAATDAPALLWRRWIGIALLILLSVSLFASLTGGLGSASVRAADPSETPTSAADVEPSQAPVGKADNGLTIKLIPDQKAFLGSPDTLIDLSDIFAETRIGDRLFGCIVESNDPGEGDQGRGGRASDEP